MARLTAKFVENVRPQEKRVEIADGGCKSLYLVVQPVSGKKSWAVRYRFQGKPRKLTLDGFPSLADARRRATAALHELEQGRDPAADKFEARRMAAQADAEHRKNTVEQLAARFIDQHGKKLRSASRRQVEHVFARYVLPAWHGRLIDGVHRRDVIALVEDIADKHPVMANRALGWVSKFFNWALERDIVAASPVHGVKRPSAERARDRVLDDDEIKSLWLACDAVGGPGTACLKVMLLLGQRRGEVSAMQRSEINGDLWRISKERMKGGQEHVLPLPTRALKIIEDMPVVGDGDLVFTATGKRPFNDFYDLKQRLDAHMKPKKPWVLHDLRRSMASGMAGLGVPVTTVEKILAHRSGTFHGVLATYQRHSFIPEMRAALERWSEHIEQLVSSTSPAKVIHIDRRR
jgi:integrase